MRGAQLYFSHTCDVKTRENPNKEQHLQFPPDGLHHTLLFKIFISIIKSRRIRQNK